MTSEKRTKLDAVIAIAREKPTTAAEIERRLQVSRTCARTYLEELAGDAVLKRLMVKTTSARQGEGLYFLPEDIERARTMAADMRAQPGVGFGSALFAGRRKAL